MNKTVFVVLFFFLQSIAFEPPQRGTKRIASEAALPQNLPKERLFLFNIVSAENTVFPVDEGVASYLPATKPYVERLKENKGKELHFPEFSTNSLHRVLTAVKMEVKLGDSLSGKERLDIIAAVLPSNNNRLIVLMKIARALGYKNLLHAGMRKLAFNPISKKQLHELDTDLLALYAHYFYLGHGRILPGTNPGFSIQELHDYGKFNRKVIFPVDRSEDDISFIDLNDLRLTSLDGLRSISGIQSVQAVYLEDNKLTTITADDFRGLDKLEVIDLAGNELRTLPKGFFVALPTLKDLDLRDNKISEEEKKRIQKEDTKKDLNLLL